MYDIDSLSLFRGIVGGPEFLIFVIVGLFVLFYWIEFFKAKQEVVATVVSIAGLGIPIGAFINPDFVRVIFGVNPPDWQTWLLWYIVLGIAAGMAYVQARAN